MKARSKKHRLEQRYAHVIKSVTHVTPETPVTISPFNAAVESLLFKTIDPLPELSDDNLDIVTEKRPRGRPRKQQAATREDKVTHKIEYDDAVSAKALNNSMLRFMISDFHQHYTINQIPLNHSLERISKAYKISYKHAYNLLEREF